jgi:hypothetical protein
MPCMCEDCVLGRPLSVCEACERGPHESGAGMSLRRLYSGRAWVAGVLRACSPPGGEPRTCASVFGPSQLHCRPSSHSLLRRPLQDAASSRDGGARAHHAQAVKRARQTGVLDDGRP